MDRRGGAVGTVAHQQGIDEGLADSRRKPLRGANAGLRY